MFILGVILVFYSDFIGFSSRLYGRDTVSMHIPYYAMLSRMEGWVLDWNPWSHCGAPGLGNAALAMLYPVNQLARWMSPVFLLHFYTFLHLLLLGISGRFFFRSFSLSPSFSIAGSLLLLASPATAGLLEYGHMTVLASWAWAPFLLGISLNAARDFRDRQPLYRRLAAFAVVLGLMMLGGHPQFNHLTLQGCGILFLFGASLKRRKWFPGLAVMLLGCILGLLLAYPQIKATLEVVPITGRGNVMQDSAFADEGRLSGSLILKMLYPPAYGISGQYWGQNDYWFANVAGSLFWLLGLGSFCLAGLRPAFRAALIASVLFLVLALGDATPLAEWHRKLVPGASYFRLPYRAVYFFYLLSIPLALKGIEVSAHGKKRALRMFLLLWLVYPVFSMIAPGMVDLFWSSVLPEHVVERREMIVGLPRIFHLKYILPALVATFCLFEFSLKKRSRLVVYLIWVICAGFQYSLLPDSSVPRDYYADVEYSLQDRVAVRNQPFARANEHLVYGLYSLGGYDSLSFFRYRSFLDTLIPQDFSKHTREQLYNLDSPALALLNLRWIAESSDALKKGPEFWRERPFLSRYYLTQNFEWEAREGSEFTAGIREHQQNLRSSYLGQGFHFPEQALPHGDASLGSVRVLEMTPSRIRLDVSVLVDSVLASSDCTGPGWRAYADGKEVKEDLWFNAFRCMALKPGEYRIEFRR